jgi:thioredoxin 1
LTDRDYPEEKKMGRFFEVTTADFDKDVVQAEGQVLVDFWAPWCGPCRMQTPILEKLAKSDDVEVNIAKCNTDENPDIAQQLGIVSIPTLILFRDGKEVDRFIGVQPEDVLREKLK